MSRRSTGTSNGSRSPPRASPRLLPRMQKETPGPRGPPPDRVHLRALCAQGFPQTAAKHALSYTGNEVGDARDLLVHQSHIRGWAREATVTGVAKDHIKPTRIGGSRCNICTNLRVLRDAGGVRTDNAAYKLYGSRHVVRVAPPPGTELAGPTGEGWITVPSSSGRGFWIVDPEMDLTAEGDEGAEGDNGADGEGEDAKKRIDGDGDEQSNPRWGDGESRPRYFEGSVAGLRFATRSSWMMMP